MSREPVHDCIGVAAEIEAGGSRFDKANLDSTDLHVIHCPALRGAAREQANRGLARVDDSVGGPVREVL